ncbi:hypothetical protein [Ancylobacter sp. IITR112]|uniref:hypothetical protein n=1 Tax=Ancylobacter sp. IITR112 TaxID=3138073 RepID=UPI00352A6AD0
MVKSTRLYVSPVMRLKSDDAKDKRIAELEAALAEAKKIGTEAVAALQQQEERYAGHCREMQSTNDRAFAARDAAQKAERAAVKAENETREQFDDLKRRLHEAELTIARLQGYIDRVSEDDAAREEPRTVTEERREPRRPPGPTFGYVMGGAMSATDAMRPRSKHWTGY